MIIKKQHNITINNVCNAIFNESNLVDAILWYSDKPVYKIKTVFLYGKYPAVSIYDKKIHIHRLLWMFYNKSDIPAGWYVHHINNYNMDATKGNLFLINSRKHQSLHNKNKKLSKEHRKKISESNRRRKGIKIKKRVQMPELKTLIKKGWSINKIAKFYGCDWSTVRNRIHQNPELLDNN
jgi:hypothetical protein